MQRYARRGITLVELLVVISVIGLLVAIALPAVMASRENARRSACQNNLRQQGTALLAHESAFKHFPTGGWGGFWVGDPDRGSGRRQPGGWIYCVLPYVERKDLGTAGRGQPVAAKHAALAEVIRSPLAIFHCPSRRTARAYPLYYAWSTKPLGSDPVGEAARNDYAANAGDQPRCEIAMYGGPLTLAEGDNPNYAWPNVSDHTGICYLRSEVSLGALRDGSSYTYLVAEKYISAAHYDTGFDHGDDWNMVTGYQDDICRTAYLPPMRDDDAVSETRFGSAHPTTFNAMFCDGSSRALSYDIDPTVHRMLANRDDVLPLDVSKLGF